MTDPEQPDFHVVDRRRAAQSAAPASSADAAEDVPVDTSSTNTTANPAPDAQNPAVNNNSIFEASASASASGQTAAEMPADSEAASDDMQMPDPAALLAYVAMQMDVKSLATVLLGVFQGQAWRALGLIANPATGQTEKNLPEAQIAIDATQFLLSKVENDLADADRREMQHRLNDLRVNYLTKMREG